MGKGKRDGFYKRDGSPYWWCRDPVDGQRRSTGFKDLAAAKLWRAARERMAADPAHAASEAATLGEWCGRFVAWKAKTSSVSTVAVARQKLGHWVRVFGATSSLSVFSEPSTFDHYVTTRRSEGPTDHTISKEVAHMLAVLKLAKRAKCFTGDLSTLRPPDLHAGYKPRKRSLNRQELARLLSQLEPRRGALVAVCVALGCRLSEAFRLLPTDFGETEVFIGGTKTEESRRTIPILSLYRPLLDAARPFLPLEPWGKAHRDLKAACKRAGIEACGPNDFRRTHATLLSEAGVDADVTRRLLGHTTRNLVDRVYGQPSTAALGELAEAKLLGAAPLLDFGIVSVPEAAPDADDQEGQRSGCPEKHLSPAEAPEEPAFSTPLSSQPSGENGVGAVGRQEDRSPEPSMVAGEPDASNSEPVTAGRDPLFLSTDVTVDWFDYDIAPEDEVHVDEIIGADCETRTRDQRFTKPLPHHEIDAGILGFRGLAGPWTPPGSGEFGCRRSVSGTAAAQ